MTIYYTAKDIEEMAAKGIRQIEVGPGITLTDFARETARQLDITLVKGGQQEAPSAPVVSPSSSTGRTSKYNKPSGCMHSSNSLPAARSQTTSPSGQSAGSGNSGTVNSLINLMGAAIKRGG